MGVRFRSWWQKIKRHPFIVGGIIVVLIAFTFAVIKFGWDWTGFNGGYGKITTHTSANDIELPPARTLWDLLQLLFVPALLTFGAVWFTTRQNHDLEVATDNQRETHLQAYISSMSELMLHEKLRGSNPEDEVRNIARVRTLRVLHPLDEERKRTVIQFLHESHLINKDDPIIDLNGANLLKASLERADLKEVNLSGAKLMGAKLIGANLSGARYNTKKIQYKDALGNLLTLEPTQWPQGFDPKVEGAICVDWLNTYH